MNIKIDERIMKLLKVEYVAHPIVNTSKGLLSLVLRKGDEKYHFVLDAVPLSEEQNAYLMKMLYEDIQSKEVGDAPRTQEDHTEAQESRVEVGSSETSERVEANKKEINGTTQDQVI